MLALHDLQSDFRRFLTGEAPEQLIRLVDGVGFEPEARLSIYRNNMLVTLTAALKSTFPVVCRLVDDRFFDYAANGFTQQNLPASPCLVEYGKDFPDFLDRFPPAGVLAYLVDVARLEWAINRVIHAPVADSRISIASLLGAPGDPADLRLSVAPDCRYVASRYPIDQIWRTNQPGADPEQTPLDGPGVHLEIRRAEGLRISDLPRAVWTFRSQIADGASLGIAAAAAMTVAPDLDLAPTLAALFDAGLVVGLL